MARFRRWRPACAVTTRHGMKLMTRLRCAILDDYFNLALDIADWQKLADRVDVTVFSHPFASEQAAAVALGDVEIICAMRERTAFPKRLFEALPKLKLLLTSGMRNASIDMEVAKARIVTIHVVLSERSRGLVGRDDLARMKPTAFLVNTARGPIVDEAALLEVLQQKKIAGAGIDVFSVEPLPVDHPFRKLDNLVITPHLGYATEEVFRGHYAQMVEGIDGWLKGDAPRKLA